MTDRVYCILCDRPSTYLQVARRLSGGRKPSQATKERVSRHIRSLRDEGMLQCVGYRDNPGYVPGTETPRWLQVWEVRHRWPTA